MDGQPWNAGSDAQALGGFMGVSGFRGSGLGFRGSGSLKGLDRV